MTRKNIGVVESKVVVRASADDCFCVASSPVLLSLLLVAVLVSSAPPVPGHLVYTLF